VAELRPGVMTETEVARIERDEQAGLADLGLRLAETKQLTAALQAEIVPAQVAVVGEHRRCCSSCRRLLVSRVIHSAGYNRFSFTRASAVVNCQSALTCFLFRLASQAATSSTKVGLSAIRRSRH
jgi:hypothetical protein